MTNLLLLFQEYAATIRDTKRAKWTAVYYAFLVLASLVGYVKVLVPEASPLPVQIVVFLAYGFVAIFTAWYVWSCHFSIERYRVRLQKIRDKLDDNVKEIVSQIDPARDQIFPVTFSIVLWIGAGFLFWSLFPFEADWLAITLITLACLEYTTANFAERLQKQAL